MGVCTAGYYDAFVLGGVPGDLYEWCMERISVCPWTDYGSGSLVLFLGILLCSNRFAGGIFKKKKKSCVSNTDIACDQNGLHIVCTSVFPVLYGAGICCKWLSANGLFIAGSVLFGCDDAVCTWIILSDKRAVCVYQRPGSDHSNMDAGLDVADAYFVEYWATAAAISKL